MMTSSPKMMAKVDSSRWIGKIEQGPTFPSIVLVGGLHGNEQSGITAIERVFSKINSENIPVLGNIYALRGNLKAIQSSQRFIDHDLNRLWTPTKVDAAKAGRLGVSETDELLDILSISEAIIYNSKADVTFVDLHTTSSDSSPFMVIDDTIRNRRIAQSVPVTLVLGVLEQLEGTLSGYLSNYGVTTLVFEAGQHDALSSIDRHEAATWMLLDALKVVDTSNVDMKAYRALLEASTKSKPKIVETRLRFGLKDEDRFKMEPGFSNFSSVKKGQLLAHYNGHKISAAFTGKIFMPLYQKQGDDGFFLTKRIAPFWLRFSEWLRRVNADRLVHYLPGVKKHPESVNTYVINKNIASLKTMQILHLLGFRKEKKVGKTLLVSRRAFDLKGPWD
ncbi:MAG: succinylglutamate desuccinylase/aspartoacylase family protein [Saprospiraceae bacterium]|nr:succinylglutamate desuccinylase/aspartoacylase family protein [Saprospiraceae bacterium]